MQKARHIVSLFLIALILLFVAQNFTVVTIRFLFWDFSMPRALLVFILILLGIVLGMLLSNLRFFKGHKVKT